jgi:prepilin peptidase CpaA
VLVGFVVTIVYTDWRYHRIPNVVTYPVMALGLVLGLIEGVPGQLFGSGFADHIAGLIIGFAVAYPFYAAGGLKAGDGKYLMAVGSLRGLGLLLYGAVYGALLGGLLALGFIAVRRMRTANDATTSMGGVMKTWIPYGVALGAGTLVALALEVSGRIAGAGA